MSDILEKTLFSLQSLISNSPSSRSPTNSPKLTSNYEQQWSRKFVSVINTICATDSKNEERKIIQSVIARLKHSFSHPSVKVKEMRELLAESMLCELLGYEVPFAHIYAIKLADHNSYPIKQMGYLAVSFFLHSRHELMLLLVNTLQKDLKSNNVLEISLALTVIAEKIGEDLLPSLITLVEEKLNHSKSNIRRKALSCIHSLSIKYPRSVKHLVPKIIGSLSDLDPSVMIAALQILMCYIKEEPSTYKHLIPNLVRVQEQILLRKFPSDMNYHTIPAPWCQTLIFQIFAILGKDDVLSSNLILPILKQTLQNTEMSQNMSFAILYECIQTIASIESSEELIEMALASITSLLRSQNSNLKYMGLEALTLMITKVKKCFATKHQPAVMECLNHPDVSIRLKTLDLLFFLSNVENVTVVCKKFMEFLEDYPLQRKSIANKVMIMIHKYSSSFSWYLNIVEEILSKDIIDLKSTHMLSINEALSRAENVESEFWINKISDYVNRCNDLHNTVPTPAFVQLIVWVFQKFAFSSPGISMDSIENSLVQIVKNYSDEEDVIFTLFPCMMLLALHENASDCSKLLNCVKKLKNHSNFITVQNFLEFERSLIVINELKTSNLKASLLSSEKQVVDPFLSTEDNYVIKSLQSGAKPYCNRSFIPPVFSLPLGSFAAKEYKLEGSNSGSMKDSSSYGQLSSNSIALMSSPSKSETISSSKSHLWTSEGFQAICKDTSSNEQSSEKNQSENDEDEEKSNSMENLFAGVMNT